MIDLHTHILPGVDDGSPDMEESVAMAELAVQSGVHTLVATPHSNQRHRFENYSSVLLGSRFEELRKTLADREVPLRVLTGMEIFCTEDTAALIEAGLLFGLNHTDYYLIEFPFDADPDWMGDRLEEVLDLGKTPLIAHPERYFCIQDYPMIVFEWLQMGCRTQANKGSFLGRFGRHAGRTVHVLAEHDLITCVASDAHSSYTRTTYMDDLRRYLTDELGQEKTRRLLEENPDRILKNRKIALHGRPAGPTRRYF
ncbi:MAG: hypothetical protein LUD14_12110 [Clostridiales bacterium]|nr:hypothetical protein [Clostridiales bacterium]